MSDIELTLEGMSIALNDLNNRVKELEDSQPENWGGDHMPPTFIGEVEKIDGLTKEQWDRVIKAGQLCKFWDGDRVFQCSLERVNRDNVGPFISRYHYDGTKYFSHCSPIIQPGYTHAWWPEIGTDKKPKGLPDDAMIYICQNNWIGCIYHVHSIQWMYVKAFIWPPDLGSER